MFTIFEINKNAVMANGTPPGVREMKSSYRLQVYVALPKTGWK